MRRIATLLAGTSFAIATPALATTPDATPAADAAPAETSAAQPTDAAAAAAPGDQDIVVTARKRSETLQDVPIAITAITGDTIERRGLNSVREVAALTPGLNVNSDGAGRAFVAIRGIGVTLVSTVQPGVGLFIDGIYQPNTAFLNNPLTDVDRVEVLRGPQGTLYGKNTLGGAINIISRQPGNDLEIRGIASYAFPDDAWTAGASIAGGLIPDVLQARVAFSHRDQDGFVRNVVIGGDANPFRSDSLNGTIRLHPGGDVTLTLNGYYDWIDGVSIPYARVTGPRDYSRDIQFNTLNRVNIHYRGINAKLEVPVESINTTIALIGAYDARNSRSPDNDVDFGPLDIARGSGTERQRTATAELRFDTHFNDQFSSLVGAFYSRETFAAVAQTRIFPLARVVDQTNDTEADTYAVFGTLFWRPNDGWEVAAGLRYDHESRDATGTALVNGIGGALPPASIKSDQVEPRLTVTRHWNNRFMSYASIARGYRGGGFNGPLAPSRTYTGDSVWTYELGSRWMSSDRVVSLSGAIFFNDYSNYIGLNSIAPTPAGLQTVDLNTGDVESYGAELEATFRPTRHWTITSGFTYVHARLTNIDAYTAITGRVLSSDRLTFQPDWNFSIYSDYVVPIGSDSLTLTAGLIGKGSRLAATLNQTTPTILDEYFLVNAAITYRHGPLELSLFANNLFNEDYFESYIEKTTLQLAGLPASDLGIIGDRARYGIRARIAF